MVNSSGALVREDCEIEGSREVFNLSIGSEITAYERSQTAAGVVRYRSRYGWLSEYRRDGQKEPLLELLSLPSVADLTSGYGTPSKESVAALSKDPGKRRLVEAMTLRESTCSAIVRIHSNLRHVASYLSRLCIVESNNLRTRVITVVQPSVAALLANSLSNIFRSFLTYPMDFLSEGDVLTMDSTTSMRRRLSDSLPSINLEFDKSEYKFFSDLKKAGKKSGRAAVTFNHSEEKGSKKGGLGGRRSGRSKGCGDVDVNTAPQERQSVRVDGAAACLYAGAVVRYVLLPVLEDRNGHLNTFIVKALLTNGVIDAFLESTIFVLSALSSAVEMIKERSARESGRLLENNDRSIVQIAGSYEGLKNTPVFLSRCGRCALHALPSMLGLVRKLVQRELYMKSAVTVSMLEFGCDNEPFYIHELLFNILSAVGRNLLPIFKNKSTILFPPDIQLEWLAVIAELVGSLQQPLPPLANSNRLSGSSATLDTGAVVGTGVIIAGQNSTFASSLSASPFLRRSNQQLDGEADLSSSMDIRRRDALAPSPTVRIAPVAATPLPAVSTSIAALDQHVADLQDIYSPFLADESLPASAIGRNPLTGLKCVAFLFYIVVFLMSTDISVI